ncbi:hypothetical protein PILCRDRAFT_11388 [Piloderma croceum F 1598]|uniref:Uncharacterized protein n=1 Tax=Piloderma croceum (strain F 1598) TaxID=765440 RepID=A0A0C3F070_PILCF|nr:hypothetical protein PILCRDRAFT_11388 [Piloderma croceum F 1598]
MLSAGLSNKLKQAIPDGSLKDTADIQQYNIPDDSAPIPSASQLSTTSTLLSAQSLAKFLSSHPPTKKPSKRTTDSDNAETTGDTFKNSQSGQKRKASAANVSHWVSHKVVESDTDSNSASDNDNQSDAADTDTNSDEDPDETHATANYERMIYKLNLAYYVASKVSKVEHTADMCTIFKLDDQCTNPDTGSIERGHWCTVCKKALVEPSVSSLKAYPHCDHTSPKKIYKEHCTKLGISMNARALPKDTNQSLSRQGTLDSAIVVQPRMPPFTTAGLLDYIIELVVSEDKAFQLVDHGSFCRLLTYTRPSLSEADIPHCTMEELENIPGQVSFTFNTLTSKTGDPFLSITGHYITASPDIRRGDTYNIDQLDVGLEDCENIADEDGGEDGDIGDDDDLDFDTGDACAKALALVKQICKSPQAKAFFNSCCEEVEVPLLQLLLWEPAEAHQSFLSSSSPTVWRTIPILEYLQETWSSMELSPQFAEIAPAIRASLNNLKKWYRKTEKTDAYSSVLVCIGFPCKATHVVIILLVLDPSVKLTYAEDKWDDDATQDGMACLKAVFDKYYTPPPALVSETTVTSAIDLLSTQKIQYGHSWMRATVQK